MHKIQWLIVVAATALTVNVGTASAEPPSLDVAERLCTQQGGGFTDIFLPFYTCSRKPFEAPFTDAQLQAAKAVCEGAYKGEFGIGGDRLGYSCDTSDK